MKKYQGKPEILPTDPSQIRAAIQMRTTTDETYPASLNELGLPASMLVCPVSQQPYQYDPTTGQVRCTTPGHMRY